MTKGTEWQDENHLDLAGQHNKVSDTKETDSPSEVQELPEWLAQRIDPRANWEDLVLSAEKVMLLHKIENHFSNRAKLNNSMRFNGRMNRDHGIIALFTGEDCKGKTMAAEVLAHELSLDLYRIDLSQVVSKYIGETEKYLRRLFDSVEGVDTILFFDEADELFGKRTEVKDNHDRYANLIDCLFTLMESYNGLVILAMNTKSNSDSNVLRRIKFIIDFPFPSQENRKRISDD